MSEYYPLLVNQHPHLNKHHSMNKLNKHHRLHVTNIIGPFPHHVLSLRLSSRHGCRFHSDKLEFFKPN